MGRFIRIEDTLFEIFMLTRHFLCYQMMRSTGFMQEDARGCKRVTEQADGHSNHWLNAFMAVSLRRKAASRMEVPYVADDDALLPFLNISASVLFNI